jgi:hypothetical protein
MSNTLSLNTKNKKPSVLNVTQELNSNKTFRFKKPNSLNLQSKGNPLFKSKKRFKNRFHKTNIRRHTKISNPQTQAANLKKRIKKKQVSDKQTSKYYKYCIFTVSSFFKEDSMETTLFRLAKKNNRFKYDQYKAATLPKQILYRKQIFFLKDQQEKKKENVKNKDENKRKAKLKRTEKNVAFFKRNNLENDFGNELIVSSKLKQTRRFTDQLNANKNPLVPYYAMNTLWQNIFAILL